MNNLIIISIVITIAIVVGVMGNSNYQDVTLARDQRHLQLTIDDCKKLFEEGTERNACIEKSIHAFGTDEQKQQWALGYYTP